MPSEVSAVLTACLSMLFVHVCLLPLKEFVRAQRRPLKGKVQTFPHNSKEFISFCQNAKCASTEETETDLGKTGETVELFQVLHGNVCLNELPKIRKCLNFEYTV